MSLFRRRLDAATRGRLDAIKARARGLARHGERATVVTPCERMADLVARIDAGARS